MFWPFTEHNEHSFSFPEWSTYIHIFFNEILQNIFISRSLTCLRYNTLIWPYWVGTWYRRQLLMNWILKQIKWKFDWERVLEALGIKFNSIMDYKFMEIQTNSLPQLTLSGFNIPGIIIIDFYTTSRSEFQFAKYLWQNINFS